MHNSFTRRKELQIADSWYQQTESKIYSESRERPKMNDGSLGEELTENQIKNNEKRLRAKYYRDIKPLGEDASDSPLTQEQYYNRMSTAKEKLKEYQEAEKKKGKK